jgi:hypothetical protein
VGVFDLAPNAITSRSACGKLSGRNSQASTMLKTVTVAPIAMASVVMTTVAKPGLLCSKRAPWARSLKKSRSIGATIDARFLGR